MRLLLPLALVVPLLALRCPPSAPPPAQPLANLAWEGPKIYGTGSTGVPLAGFGVNAMVDELPLAPLPMTVPITKSFTNDGAAKVPAGYVIGERVQRMQFIAAGGSAGFQPAPTSPIANLRMRGQALAPGDTLTAGFTFAVAACGLYKETLTLDSANTIPETTKSDNVAVHYFAVPGTQSLKITKTSVGGTDLWHDTKPGPRGAPNWVTIPASLPYKVWTFKITATTPGTTFYYNYETKPMVGLSGSTAQLVGPAPVQPPGPGVAGPITITLQLSKPVTHDNQPFTDILTELVQEQFNGMVTAITADGCFARQSSGSFSVWHPGR